MAFSVRTSKPGAGNKNFIRSATGGWNTCIQGNPTDRQCDVLANCVGYASGRFNEIINQVRGTSGCTYKTLNCNAENFIERALAAGLKIGSTPRVGAIMCWQKGSLSSSDGAGHVAIVERVNSNSSVYTSESGYGSSAFWNQTRSNSNGKWGFGSSYGFRAFIYLPDDVQNKIGGSAPAPSVSGSIDELARDVIAGKYGNGDARKAALGDKFSAVQARVNEILSGNSTSAPVKKSNEEIANEVIQGNWGNGDDRKKRLTEAGYDYSAIQAIVNNKVNASQPAPAPQPAPVSYNIGDTVYINGVLTADSYGGGAHTRSYSNQAAKIIMIKDDGRARPFALNCNNNMNGVTGWASKDQIRK